MFLAAERGIPHNPEQHAAYVGAWIKTLKEDENEIFRAGHDASRAADFLLALERVRSIAGELPPARPVLDPEEIGRAPSLVLKRETANLERHRRDRKMQERAHTGRLGR